MNPFDFNGPQFLMFYVVLAIAGSIALKIYYDTLEEEPPGTPPANVNDPLSLAFLRGGDKAALNLTVFSLIQRGCIHAIGDKLHPQANAEGDNPAEREVLSLMNEGGDSVSRIHTYHFPFLIELRKHLTQLGLLRTDAVLTQRFRAGLVWLAVLIGVGLLRMQISAARGHHNTDFLWFMMIAILISGLSFVTNARKNILSRKGTQWLADLRNLNPKPKPSQWEGISPLNLTLAAALFGLAILPAEAFPEARRLFPDDNLHNGFGGDGGGGGGDGGGGCGGGCGGCGGCGG